MSTEERCLLWQGEPPGSPIQDDFRPWLEFYPSATDGLCGAVIVCAGGGYNMRAEHEGEVVARRYQQAGFHAFLLQYRVAPHPPSAAFRDAAECVRLIRARQMSGKWTPTA